VSDEGKIQQKEVTEQIKVPENAADRAINVRVEGWTVPVEMRVVVAVNPVNAAKVVASVGGLKQVEDNIITPVIRDILRTIGGHPDRKVLDLVEKRGEIVAELERAIVPEGLKAGVTIQEVRMGEPAIPPELPRCASNWRSSFRRPIKRSRTHSASGSRWNANAPPPTSRRNWWPPKSARRPPNSPRNSSGCSAKAKS
jgi:hypothetical protein